MQVGDIDNNGIDDVALAYLDNGVVHIAVILVTGNPVARLSMQTITTLGIAGTDQVKLSKIGDSDSDGVEDLMISNYNDATGTLAIKRVLLQAT